jgi:hypothetical protein
VRPLGKSLPCRIAEFFSISSLFIGILLAEKKSGPNIGRRARGKVYSWGWSGGNRAINMIRI